MSVSTARSSLGEYRRLEKLGEGTYGIVYKCTHTPTGKTIALKKIKNDSDEEGISSTTLREISLLKHLKHPCIIELFRSLYIGGDIFLVFNFMDGDVNKYLFSSRRPLPLAEIKLLAYQLIEGVRVCHANRVLHRDLKPANLLLNYKTGRLKLADFGLGREHGLPIGKLTHEVVTMWYRPPEVLLGQQKYSGACDMWAVGCIIAEMATKVPYFPGDSEIDQMFKIFQTMGTPTDEQWPTFRSLPNYKASFPKWRPKDPFKQMKVVQTSRVVKHSVADRVKETRIDDCGIGLVNRFLCLAPFKRMTAKEALRHEWFDEVREQLDAELQREMDALIDSAAGHCGFVKGHSSSLVGSKAGMPVPSRLRPVDANAQCAPGRSRLPPYEPKPVTGAVTTSGSPTDGGRMSKGDSDSTEVSE